jgi:hypothetical protein
MNNMKTYRIITLLAIVCPIRALAQESVELPSRSITVESTYNPIFSEVGKIMPLPEKESASRQQVPVNYLTEANPYGERIRKEMNVFGLESDNVKSRAPLFSCSKYRHWAFTSGTKRLSISRKPLYVCPSSKEGPSLHDHNSAIRAVKVVSKTFFLITDKV